MPISDLLGLINSGSEKTKGNSLRLTEYLIAPRTSLGLLEDRGFANLIKMVAEAKISSRGAKDILKIMFEHGGEPAEIAEKENLLQKSDLVELEKIAEKIIAENSKVVADYKAGKEAALMSLVGQGMKVTKGSANPQVLKEVFLKLLKNEI